MLHHSVSALFHQECFDETRYLLIHADMLTREGAVEMKAFLRRSLHLDE